MNGVVGRIQSRSFIRYRPRASTCLHTPLLKYCLLESSLRVEVLTLGELKRYNYRFERVEIAADVEWIRVDRGHTLVSWHLA